MEQYKGVIVLMTADSLWTPRDAEGRRRTLTAEELDALAEISWLWAGMRHRLTAGVNAVRAGWRSRTRFQVEPTALPSSDAAA